MRPRAPAGALSPRGTAVARGSPRFMAEVEETIDGKTDHIAISPASCRNSLMAHSGEDRVRANRSQPAPDPARLSSAPRSIHRTAPQANRPSADLADRLSSAICITSIFIDCCGNLLGVTTSRNVGRPPRGSAQHPLKVCDIAQDRPFRIGGDLAPAARAREKTSASSA